MTAVSNTPTTDYDGNGFLPVTRKKESLQVIMLVSRHAETDRNGHF
jgi:hypothetical protein